MGKNGNSGEEEKFINSDSNYKQPDSASSFEGDKSNKLEDIYSSLTKQEEKILSLIGEGYTSRQIGEKEFISHRTVETHRSNIIKKLRRHNNAPLVINAHEYVLRKRNSL